MAPFWSLFGPYFEIPILPCRSETGIIKDGVVLLKQTSSPLTHITGWADGKQTQAGRLGPSEPSLEPSKSGAQRAAAASGHIPPRLNHRLMNIGLGQLTGAHMCIVTKCERPKKDTIVVVDM